MQTRHDPLPCGVRHWEILTAKKKQLQKASRFISAGTLRTFLVYPEMQTF